MDQAKAILPGEVFESVLSKAYQEMGKILEGRRYETP
jgi:hypothetical protein